MRRSLYLIISFVGASGQALFFYHELAESYPYKVSEAARLFELIAHVGLVTAPIGALLLAWLLCRKRREWALPTLSTLFSPALFLLLYIVAHLIDGYPLVYSTNLCGCVPLYDLAEKGLWLAGIGMVVGALCAVIIELMARLTRKGSYRSVWDRRDPPPRLP